MAESNIEDSKLPEGGLKIYKLCMPCKDKRVPADRFCIECEAYFCAHCSQHFHAAIPALAKHVILKDDEIDVWGQLQYKCETHNKMFTFFCKGHDALCCAVCIHLEHSTCKEKEYIQTAAEGICNAQELVQLKAETKDILDKISECKEKFQSKSTANEESKHKVVDSIKQHRKKINVLFDALDENSLKQMEAKFDSNKAYITKSLKSLTGYNYDGQILNQQVNSAREDKNCLVYICLKQGNELVKNIKKNVCDMDCTTAKDNFVICIDEKIEYFVKTRKETGHMEDDHSRASDECRAKREVIPKDKGDLICQLEENKKLLEKDNAKIQNTVKEKDLIISRLEAKVKNISRQNDDLKKTTVYLEKQVLDLESNIKKQQEQVLKTEETCKALVHGKNLGDVLPTLSKELSVLDGSKLRDLYKDMKDEVARLSIRKLAVQVYGTDSNKSEKQRALAILVSRFSAVGMVLATEEIQDPKHIDPDVPLLIICREYRLSIKNTIKGLSFSGPTAIAVQGHEPDPTKYHEYFANLFVSEIACIVVSVEGSFSNENDEAINKIVQFIQTFGKLQPVEDSRVDDEHANKDDVEVALVTNRDIEERQLPRRTKSSHQTLKSILFSSTGNSSRNQPPTTKSPNTQTAAPNPVSKTIDVSNNPILGPECTTTSTTPTTTPNPLTST